MIYSFTSFSVKFPERGSEWTGYRTAEEAARTAGSDGVVCSRVWTAEVPAWRVEALDAEIAAGLQVAQRVTA